MDVSKNSSSDESHSNADSDSDATIALHDPFPRPTLLISAMSATDAVNDPLMQRSDQGKGLYIEAVM